MKRRPFKKMKKLRFLAADVGKCEKEKILHSPNLPNMARGTLILKDYDIGTYPCSYYGSSNFQQLLQSPRYLIFVKKHEIMRTFEIRYEDGWIFNRSLVKVVRNRQSKQKKN